MRGTYLDVALLDEELLDVVTQLLEVPLVKVVAALHLGDPCVEVEPHLGGAFAWSGGGGDAGAAVADEVARAARRQDCPARGEEE